MKILVLGSGGMAGHILNDNLKLNPEFEVYNAAREKINSHTILFDALDKQSVTTLLDEVMPDITINAVGLLVKQANANQANAVLINSYFPHLLSQLTKERNGYTIHLSTDCVFSGHKGGYLVNDLKDAEDFYGQSKALGELNNENDLTIRTSIIGPEIKTNGTGLFHWYVRSSGRISGYDKVFWSGITTLELSKIIVKAIQLNEKGLVQLSNDEKISKYELLRLIGMNFNKDISLIGKEEEIKHDKSLVCSVPQSRYQVAGYAAMIEELKNYIFSNKSIYSINYPQIF